MMGRARSLLQLLLLVALLPWGAAVNAAEAQASASARITALGGPAVTALASEAPVRAQAAQTRQCRIGIIGGCDHGAGLIAAAPPLPAGFGATLPRPAAQLAMRTLAIPPPRLPPRSV